MTEHRPRPMQRDRERRRPGKAATKALTAIVVLLFATPIAGANGQELEARSYTNAPTGLNFLIAGYGYTDGNVVFGASTPIEDAKVQTHATFLAYLRSIRLGDLSGKVGAIVPYAWASGSAVAFGQTHTREVSGLGDPKFRLTVNLYGAPPLTLQEFAGYKQDLIVGATVDVSAPLGKYDSTKLLNLGSNRWSIRSELGISKSLPPFTLELSAGATVFTRNDDFFGGKTLDQAPLYAAQGHIVYEFRPGLWAAVDAVYYNGGRTTTDGTKGDRQEGLRSGLTVSLPVSRYNSLKFYGSTGLYSRTGTDFDAIGAAWLIRWGAGL